MSCFERDAMNRAAKNHERMNVLCSIAGSGLVLGCLLLVPNVAMGSEKKGEPKEEEVLCPEAKTQLEMNGCAYGMYQEEDAELNRVYREILKRYKQDRVFIGKFKAAQRAWIKFRDAQFEAMFPQILDSRGQYNYGSVFPMCSSLYKARLTHSRVEELRAWLDGTEEGDVCSGSLPSKEEKP
jgi:uncharacterized protein YecT (DUF1311 family)